MVLEPIPALSELMFAVRLAKFTDPTVLQHVAPLEASMKAARGRGRCHLYIRCCRRKTSLHAGDPRWQEGSSKAPYAPLVMPT